MATPQTRANDAGADDVWAIDVCAYAMGAAPGLFAMFRADQNAFPRARGLGIFSSLVEVDLGRSVETRDTDATIYKLWRRWPVVRTN